MFGKILAGVVVIALAGLLFWGYGKASYNSGELAERVKWKDVAFQHEKELQKLERGYRKQQITAISDYADRLKAQEPIILRSKETVLRYAQTDAGRVECLDADRVRGIETDRSFLFPGYTSAPDGGTTTVPSSEHIDR